MARVLLLGVALLLPLACACGSSSETDTEGQDPVVETMADATDVANQQERAIARAWEMAQAATAWAAIDPVAARQAIDDSVRAAEEAAAGGDEQRRVAADLREKAATWDPVDFRSAIPLAERIERNASRAWILRAIAGALADLDPDQSTTLLATALEITETNPLPQYRAADETTVALELARLDPAGAQDVASAIADPAAKARALREMAEQLADMDPELAATLLSEAVDAAREVSDPYDRAWALRQSAVAAGADATRARELLAEAEEAARQVDGEEPQAFALSDIAAAWASLDLSEAMTMVDGIAANYPEARVAALVGIAEELVEPLDGPSGARFVRDPAGMKTALEEALLENEEVLDTYERARAVNAVVARMATLDIERAEEIAREIEDPYLQADALRVLAVASAEQSPDDAVALAEEIEPAFIRVEALIAVGQEIAAEDSEKAITIFEGALSEAGELSDTYPLGLLASAWAPLDPAKAEEITDRVEDSGDLARALADVALATLAMDEVKAQAIFETAQETAEGMKSDDDPFLAAAALRDLAAVWLSVDEAEAGRLYEAAFDAAAAVPVETTG